MKRRLRIGTMVRRASVSYVKIYDVQAPHLDEPENIAGLSAAFPRISDAQ